MGKPYSKGLPPELGSAVISWGDSSSSRDLTFIPKKLEVTYPTSERLTWTHHPKKVTVADLPGFWGSWQFHFLPCDPFLGPNMSKHCYGYRRWTSNRVWDGETWAFSSEVLSDSWWFSWILGFEYPILDEVFTVTSAILGLELESLFFLVQVHVFFSPQKTIRVAKI